MSSSAAPTIQEGQQPLQPLSNPFEENRFIYEDFAGRKGFKLLCECMMDIMTDAHYKTWRSDISFQTSADKPPYAGVDQVARRRHRQPRKIQIDHQGMEDLGILKLTPGREKVGKQIVQVTYKDYENAYHLAKEYLEWKRIGGLQSYRPDREGAELIKQNQKLCKKLRRYANYRKVLDTKRPGPIRIPKLEPAFPYDEDISEFDIIAHSNVVPDVVSDSPYRIYLNKENLTNKDISNHSSVPPTDIDEVAQESSTDSTHPYDDVIVEQEEDSEEKRELSPSDALQSPPSIEPLAAEPAAPTIEPQVQQARGYTNTQDTASYSQHDEPQHTNIAPQTDETGASEAVTLPLPESAAPAKDVNDTRKQNSHDKRRAREARRARHSDNSSKEVDGAQANAQGDTGEAETPTKEEEPKPVLPETAALELTDVYLKLNDESRIESALTRAAKLYEPFREKLHKIEPYTNSTEKFATLIALTYEQVRYAPFEKINKKNGLPNGMPYFFRALERKVKKTLIEMDGILTLFAMPQQDDQDKTYAISHAQGHEVIYFPQERSIVREEEGSTATQKQAEYNTSEKDQNYQSSKTGQQDQWWNAMQIKPASEGYKYFVQDMDGFFDNGKQTLLSVIPCKHCGSTAKIYIVTERGKCRYCPVCQPNAAQLTPFEHQVILEQLVHYVPENIVAQEILKGHYYTT